MERIKLGITPVIQPRADAVIAMEKQRMEQSDVEMRLVAENTDIVKKSNH